MIYIVTALKSEAKPIIDFFKLKKSRQDRFLIFENRDITLIVSGIGSINSAIATTYLNPKNREDIVINIGICGGATEKIGAIFQIKKIIDKESSKVIHLKSKEIFKNHTITTCQKAQSRANEFKNSLVDMESFGFYLSAVKFVYSQNIYLIKVVSDNILDDIPIGKEVYNLIYQHLDSIQKRLF